MIWRSAINFMVHDDYCISCELVRGAVLEPGTSSKCWTSSFQARNWAIPQKDPRHGFQIVRRWHDIFYGDLHDHGALRLWPQEVMQARSVDGGWLARMCLEILRCFGRSDLHGKLKLKLMYFYISHCCRKQMQGMTRQDNLKSSRIPQMWMRIPYAVIFQWHDVTCSFLMCCLLDPFGTVVFWVKRWTFDNI